MLKQEQYLAIAIRQKIRVIVPRYPRLARANGLRLYVPNTKLARFYWAAFRLLERTGIILLQSDTKTEPFVHEVLLNWKTWVEILRQPFNEEEIYPAFYFPPQHARGKVSVLLMAGDGRLIGFGKIAFVNESREGICRESSALRWLQTKQWKSFDFPKILGHGNKDHISYLIETLKPAGTKRMSVRSSGGNHVALSELYQESKTKKHISDMSWFANVRTCSEIWRQIGSIVQELERPEGYAMCAVHGDYAPWNMLRTREDGVWLFDWEDFSDCAPSLVDQLHYWMVVYLLLKRTTPKNTGRIIGHMLEYQIKTGVFGLGDVLLALTYLRFRRPFFNEIIWDALVTEVVSWNFNK